MGWSAAVGRTERARQRERGFTRTVHTHWGNELGERATSNNNSYDRSRAVSGRVDVVVSCPAAVHKRQHRGKGGAKAGYVGVRKMEIIM